jgi:hypothetical protein
VWISLQGCHAIPCLLLGVTGRMGEQEKKSVVQGVTSLFSKSLLTYFEFLLVSGLVTSS